MGKRVKKRSWRKNDIDDVEEAVEDDRLINKMKQKTDESKGLEELFTIDTTGSGEGLSQRSKREIARAKLFPAKGPNLGLSASEELKIERAKGQLGAQKRKPAQQESEAYDLWGSGASAAAKPRKHAQFERLRMQAIKDPTHVPKTINQKVSRAPAVLPAHEGQSMNPEVKAYENLACLAAAKQLEREREAEDLDRKINPVTAALRDEFGDEAVNAMDEATKVKRYRALVCKSGSDGAEDVEGEASAKSFLTGSKKLKQKKESLRNKQKKRKGLDAKQEQLRAQKQLEKSVGQLGAIMKDMKEEDARHKGRKEYRDTMRKRQVEMEETEGIVPKKRRLGREKFSEPAIVVPDAGSASKGLRAMPLKGSAVHERISSIVRRGMLPAAPEASKHEVSRKKRSLNKLKSGRKFISPLLRENLLLR